MNFKTHTLFLLFISISAFAQNSNELIKDYYDTGELKSEAWVNEEQNYDGLFRSYYRSGKKWAEVIFKDGYKNGIQKIYLENGKLKEQGTFVNNISQGLWYLNVDSINTVVLKIYKDGLEDGTALEYRNDSLKLLSNYKEGKKDGV